MKKLIWLFLAWCLFFNGASRDFDGVGDIINCGSAFTFLDALTPKTMIAWIYPETLGESSAGRIGNWVNSAATAGGTWRLDNTGGNCMVFQHVGTTTLLRRSSAGTITLNKWTAVAMTWDGSTTAANVHLYIDLIEPSYQTTTNGVSLGVDGTTDFIIGNITSGIRTFNGNIAYVQIFDVVLTNSEIRQATYIPGSITRGLVGYWPLWGTASPEQDLSGNGNTGTLTGTTENFNGPPVQLTSGVQ